MSLKKIVFGLVGAVTCWFIASVLISLIYNYIVSIIEAGNDGNWGSVLVGALIIYLGGGLAVLGIVALIVLGIFCLLTIT